MRLATTPRRRGFRRIDLLVVLSLTVVTAGVLAAYLFMPSPGPGARGGQRGGVRSAANRSVSSNNLKQITLSAINNADQNNGDMAGIYTNTNFGMKGGGTTGSVFYVIMPQMDNDPIFKAGFTAPNEYNSTVGTVPTLVVKSLFAPGDPTADQRRPWTSYVANSQAFFSWDVTGAVVGNTSPNRFPGGISDGPSQTVAFAEAHQVPSSGPRLWADWNSAIGSAGGRMFENNPAKFTADGALPQSYHSSGIIVGLFDGSARNVVPSLTSDTWKAAWTPAGNVPLGTDW